MERRVRGDGGAGETPVAISVERRWTYTAVALGLVLAFLCQCLAFVAANGQTYDEGVTLAAGLRLDRDAFQRDLATTWRHIKRKPTPTNKKAMQRSDFSGELTAEQLAYAGADAVMAFQVWEACRAEARSRPYEIARDAIPAVASMEMAGPKVRLGSM